MTQMQRDLLIWVVIPVAYSIGEAVNSASESDRS